MLRRGFYLLLLILAFWMVAPATKAATCQDIARQQVCLLRIKRSAKYYWEYRAILSIDGRKQPERVYNCRDLALSEALRDRYYQEPDRLKVYYQQNDKLGKTVCRLYEKV